MQHVIDKASGAIIELCLDGTDVSRFPTDHYLIINSDTEHDPASEIWSTDLGKFIPIPDDIMLLKLKKERYDQLSDDYAAYVASRGYRLDWQNYTNELRERCKDVISDASFTVDQQDAAQKIIDKIEALSKWMIIDLARYFFNKGVEIFNAADEDKVNAVTWDFSQFDATDPHVRLGQDIFPVLFGTVFPE